MTFWCAERSEPASEVSELDALRHRGLCRGSTLSLAQLFAKLVSLTERARARLCGGFVRNGRQ